MNFPRFYYRIAPFCSCKFCPRRNVDPCDTCALRCNSCKKQISAGMALDLDGGNNNVVFCQECLEYGSKKLGT